MIRIDQSKVTEALARTLQDGCPFGAIRIDEAGMLQIEASCRLCRQCLKLDTLGALTLDEGPEKSVSGDWNGICVLGEFLNGRLHPVTLELLGKARELAKGHMPVMVALPGHGVSEAARFLCDCGADTVYTYDDERLAAFEPVRFAACMEDCIRRVRPAVVMAGATAAGRSLAPRLAARFHTGLTADCTALSLSDDCELHQTRPAFGGNVMAEIVTKAARPQMCTVRYRVFDPPLRQNKGNGRIVALRMPEPAAAAEVLRVIPKPLAMDLSEADAIIAVGRGCATARNIEDAYRLARLLGAQVGCTRPLVEAGLFDPKRQIGLSGRTVKPKYLIALGISGSVQFAAGMSGASKIIAVNHDPAAPIFGIAHVGLCCDAGAFLPEIIQRVEQEKETQKEVRA